MSMAVRYICWNIASLGLGTQWSLSMVVMPLVTLLLSLQIGAAKLQRLEHQCMMPNWPSFHQPSLALGSRCQCQFSPASLPKPTFTNKGLRHKLSRPQHHQLSAQYPQAQAQAEAKGKGSASRTAASTSATTAPVLACDLLPSSLARRQLGPQQQGGTQASVGSCLRPWCPTGQSWIWVMPQLSQCKWSQAYLLPIRCQNQLQFPVSLAGRLLQ